MPSRLAAPVLTVDAAKMHKVDPRNVESLFGMWMVFSKCAESIEEGKRLENLSWRLWNRETFCCEAQPHLATTPAIRVVRRHPSAKEVPSLSSSVDSAASDEAERRTQTVRPATFPRHSRRRADGAEDSALSRSRGKEKHITSLGLEKMIINIKEKTDLEPLSPTLAASLPAAPPTMSDLTPRPCSPFPDVEADKSSPESHVHNSSDSCFSNDVSESTISNGSSTGPGSDTSVSSGGLAKSASVIKGFSPSQLSSSFRPKSKLSQEIGVPAPLQPVGKLDVQKKSNVFTLGGTSSGEDESSFEDRISRQPRQSSLSNSLKSKAVDKSKPPCFRDIVQSRRIEEAEAEDEDAIESGDEDEDEDEDDDGEASESAIEEDDAAWEDSDSDSGQASPSDKNMFQRVESQAKLPSRPSMLTMQLHNPQRALALANAASRSSPALRRSRTSPPNGPSQPDSSDENEGESVLTMRGPQSSRPMPILTTGTTSTHPRAHSPRTTRRNMLATELTESLRKHLLWERKQKSTTANAFLKRRHTTRDVAHLQDYPDLRPDHAAVEASNNSWNHYFEGPWEYHTKGW